MNEHIIRLSSMLTQDAGAPSIHVAPSYHKSVGRHSHDFFELVYIREGFCLHEIAGKMTLLLEGDLFMVEPGDYHGYIGNRVVSLFNCLFSPEQVPEALKAQPVFADDISQLHPLHLELGERKETVRLLQAMLDELRHKPPGWQTKLGGLLNCLLVDYARLYNKHIAMASDKQAYTGYVIPALLYIDQHYAGDLTVSEIAKAVGISADYLTRQFRLVTGITPLEYLQRYRFARAMELFQQNVSVTDAAAQVGFMSLAHFSREFKKKLGITPSQYRNKNKQGG